SLRHLEGRLSGQLNLGNFIHFKPRLAEKGKVVANFILEFTKPIPSASSQIITEP
ncbi:PREDICTED: LOC109948635, partial [Prunus dulcis]